MIIWIVFDSLLTRTRSTDPGRGNFELIVISKSGQQTHVLYLEKSIGLMSWTCREKVDDLVWYIASKKSIRLGSKRGQ